MKLSGYTTELNSFAARLLALSEKLSSDTDDEREQLSINVVGLAIAVGVLRNTINRIYSPGDAIGELEGSFPEIPSRMELSFSGYVARQDWVSAENDSKSVRNEFDIAIHRLLDMLDPA